METTLLNNAIDIIQRVQKMLLLEIYCLFLQIYILFLMMEQQESFQFTYKEYTASLTFTEKEVLMIKVQDTKAVRYFSEEITLEYINMRAEFTNLIETPRQLMRYFKNHPDKIIVQNGIIRFAFEYGAIQKKMKHFQIELKEVDNYSGLRHQIAHLKRVVAQQANENMILRDKQQEKLVAIDTLKLANESNLRKIEDLQRREERNSEQIQQLFEELRSLSNKYVSLSEIYKYFDILGSHPDNPMKQYYEVRAISGTSIQITRVGKTGACGFANKTPVLPGQKVKYSLRLVELQYITFGFCTRQNLGKGNVEKFKDTVIYGSFGWMNEHGVAKKIHIPAIKDDFMEVQADLVNWKFTWFKNEKEFCVVDVPITMRNKEIFLTIQLVKANEKVDLFI